MTKTEAQKILETPTDFYPEPFLRAYAGAVAGFTMMVASMARRGDEENILHLARAFGSVINEALATIGREREGEGAEWSPKWVL